LPNAKKMRLADKCVWSGVGIDRNASKATSSIVEIIAGSQGDGPAIAVERPVKEPTLAPTAIEDANETNALTRGRRKVVGSGGANPGRRRLRRPEACIRGFSPVF
jgi:hypothetical protein